MRTLDCCQIISKSNLENGSIRFSRLFPGNIQNCVSHKHKLNLKYYPIRVLDMLQIKSTRYPTNKSTIDKCFWLCVDLYVKSSLGGSIYILQINFCRKLSFKNDVIQYIFIIKLNTFNLIMQLKSPVLHRLPIFDNKVLSRREGLF